MSPFDELEKSKALLHEGLRLLAESAAEPSLSREASDDSTWTRVLEDLKTLPSPDALRSKVPAPDLPAFDAALQELLRLNAVLTAAATKEQESILHRVRAVRETRRQISYYGQVSPEGEHCDVSG